MSVKISFVIPSYNSAAWLAQAVGSCLDQSVKDIEVVVVDDGSSDSTKDYLLWQEKKDKRVVPVFNAKNMGRSFSRNLGNKVAQADIICVLDADDLALPNRAKITLDAFGRGCEFFYGSAVTMDPCGRAMGELRADVFDKEKALERKVNGITHSTVAYTKRFAQRFPYREGEADRLGTDDWAQQIEAAISGVKFDFTPNILCAYRLLESAITSNRDPKEVAKFKDTFLDSLKVLGPS